MGKWAAVLAVGCVAALAPATVGFDAVGALVSLGEGSTNTTITSSTRHTTSTQRVDLEDAPPPECDFPGTDPTLVDETSVDSEPVITLQETIGPATIMIGENESVPFYVEAGTNNLNVLTAYETVITQYFQATAAGEACAVVAAAARFTG